MDILSGARSIRAIIPVLGVAPESGKKREITAVNANKDWGEGYGNEDYVK